MERLSKGMLAGLVGERPDISDEEMQQRIAEHYAAQGIYCLTCYGSKAVTRAVWVDIQGQRRYDEPDEGGWIQTSEAIPCPECGGFVETAEQAKVRRIRASGIPGVFARYFTFALWDSDLQPSMRPAFQAAKQYADHPQGGLVLAGPKGVGKTHLAIAAAQELAASGLAVRYGEAQTIIESLRKAVGDERYQDELAAWMDWPAVLVMDDYGAQRATGFSEPVLEQILLWRYSRGQAFIVTTNLGPSEIPDRLASRWRDKDWMTVVRCEGDDMRSLVKGE